MERPVATSGGWTRWRWAVGLVGLAVVTGLIFLWVPNLSHPGSALPANWRSSAPSSAATATATQGSAHQGPIALWVGDNDSTGAGASAADRAFPQLAATM